MFGVELGYKEGVESTVGSRVGGVRDKLSVIWARWTLTLSRHDLIRDTPQDLLEGVARTGFEGRGCTVRGLYRY